MEKHIHQIRTSVSHFPPSFAFPSRLRSSPPPSFSASNRFFETTLPPPSSYLQLDTHARITTEEGAPPSLPPSHQQQRDPLLLLCVASIPPPQVAWLSITLNLPAPYQPGKEKEPTADDGSSSNINNTKEEEESIPAFLCLVACAEEENMPNRHRGELEKKYPQLPSIAASAADRRATSNKKREGRRGNAFGPPPIFPPYLSSFDAALSLQRRRRCGDKEGSL